MAVYSFERGETITIALDAVSGDPTTVTTKVAHLRQLAQGKTRPSPGALKVADFVITNRPADADFPAGWTLTVPADVSATIPSGTYYADLLFTLAGSTTITSGNTINIEEPATVLA